VPGGQRALVQLVDARLHVFRCVEVRQVSQLVREHRVARLPELHRDPFDRMLICQAIMGGLMLLTPDPLIRQHAVSTSW
jgi:PIN domain nuclease of toxin-antitoxin system